MDSSKTHAVAITAEKCAPSDSEAESSKKLIHSGKTSVAAAECTKCNESAVPFKNSALNSSKVEINTPTATCGRCTENGETSPDTQNETTKCTWKDYRGILFSLGSGLASTFGGIIVRAMKDFHPFSLATYRFQVLICHI